MILCTVESGKHKCVSLTNFYQKKPSNISLTLFCNGSGILINHLILWKVVYLCSHWSNFLSKFIHHSQWHTNPLGSLHMYMVSCKFESDLICLVHSHHSFWNSRGVFIICVLYVNGRFVPFVVSVASWLKWLFLHYCQPECIIWDIMTCKKDNGLQSMQYQYKASLF